MRASFLPKSQTVASGGGREENGASERASSPFFPHCWDGASFLPPLSAPRISAGCAPPQPSSPAFGFFFFPFERRLAPQVAVAGRRRGERPVGGFYGGGVCGTMAQQYLLRRTKSDEIKCSDSYTAASATFKRKIFLCFVITF